MAQTIINSGIYTVTKDNLPIVDGVSVTSQGVTVFEDDDFEISKTPEFTTWLDTASPLTYTITFSNTSGTTVDTISITDQMPQATTENPGLTLDPATIDAQITPSENVTIDTDLSSETELIVNVTSDEGSAIADGAVLVVTFSTNYVPPLLI